METEKEMLNTSISIKGDWQAYKEGIQISNNEAFNYLRNQAAIAAMQGTITILSSSDRYAFREVVVEGFRGDKKTYPNEIAQFAVACADALIEELKKK